MGKVARVGFWAGSSLIRREGWSYFTLNSVQDCSYLEGEKRSPFHYFLHS